MPQPPERGTASEFLTVILRHGPPRLCRTVLQTSFAHVQLLTLSAVLAPGKRTITALLRIVGLQQEKAFHKYHQVLSHARWSLVAMRP